MTDRELKPGKWIDEMAEVPRHAWPQPIALRLADELDYGLRIMPEEIRQACAAELRRLHATNTQLLEALEPFVTIGSGFDMDDVLRGRAAIAAAKENT